jgi:putative oxidoreductase
MTLVGQPQVWTPQLKSLARVIVGFMLFRHGMEQVLGFPDAYRDVPTTSLFGALKLLCFPGGLLVMLGLFTRPVTLVLSVALLGYWLADPFLGFVRGELGLYGRGGLFGNGGAPSDPLLLPAFFFLHLFVTGPGVWSLDRWRGRDDEAPVDPRWASYSLGALRMLAGFLFVFHGIPKLSRFNLTSVRGTLDLIGLTFELGGGPLLVLGLYSRQLTFLFSGMMATAYFLNHAPDGFWGSFVEPNQQAAILNCYLFLYLWAAGPGVPNLAGLLARRRERLVPQPAVR